MSSRERNDAMSEELDDEAEEGVIWPGFFTRNRKIAAWTFLLSGFVCDLIGRSVLLLCRFIFR
jgi:hypothetical protein